MISMVGMVSMTREVQVEFTRFHSMPHSTYLPPEYPHILTPRYFDTQIGKLRNLSDTESDSQRVDTE